MQITLRAMALTAALVCFALSSSSRLVPEGIATSAEQVIPPEQRIDINHASIDELMKAPGMTRTWAARIVRFRPYRTKLDLLEQGVVPGQVYDRIKDFVIAHRSKNSGPRSLRMTVQQGWFWPEKA